MIFWIEWKIYDLTLEYETFFVERNHSWNESLPRFFAEYEQILCEYKFFTQWAFTCSKLTIETLEQGVRYVQS